MTRLQNRSFAIWAALILSGTLVSVRAVQAGTVDFDGNIGGSAGLQQLRAAAKEIPAASAVQAQVYCDPNQTYNGGPCARIGRQPGDPNRYRDRVREPRRDDSGYNAAMTTCQLLFNNSDKIYCMRMIGRARYFDLGAVTACGVIFDPADKIECLATIADRRFDPRALQMCTMMPDALEKIDCLRLIAR